MEKCVPFPRTGGEIQQSSIADVVLLRRIILKILQREAALRDDLLMRLLDGAPVEEGEHDLVVRWVREGGRRVAILELDGRPLDEIRLEE